MGILSFYRGESPDHAGRKIGDIWAFSTSQLEDVHDFIQWLFPLEVPSPVNPEAPTLSADDMRQFRSDPELQAKLRRSLGVMLTFYGLELYAAGAGVKVVKAANFAPRSGNWLTPGNHNHLRLTRIVHCLALCGLRGEAEALLACLLEIAREHPRDVTARTLEFWRGAVKG